MQQRNAYAPTHNQDTTNGTPQSQYGWSQNVSSNQPQQQKSHANGFSTSQKAEGSIQAPAASHPAPGQPASAANGKSVAEYRKKAQGAILNLLPYDVRYQTYIDEGFREDIVGALFDDLKLARFSPRIDWSTSTTAETQPPKTPSNRYGLPSASATFLT